MQNSKTILGIIEMRLKGISYDDYLIHDLGHFRDTGMPFFYAQNL